MPPIRWSTTTIPHSANRRWLRDTPIMVFGSGDSGSDMSASTSRYFRNRMMRNSFSFHSRFVSSDRSCKDTTDKAAAIGIDVDPQDTTSKTKRDGDYTPRLISQRLPLPRFSDHESAVSLIEAKAKKEGWLSAEACNALISFLEAHDDQARAHRVRRAARRVSLEGVVGVEGPYIKDDELAFMLGSLRANIEAGLTPNKEEWERVLWKACKEKEVAAVARVEMMMRHRRMWPPSCECIGAVLAMAAERNLEQKNSVRLIGKLLRVGLIREADYVLGKMQERGMHIPQRIYRNFAKALTGYSLSASSSLQQEKIAKEEVEQGIKIAKKKGRGGGGEEEEEEEEVKVQGNELEEDDQGPRKSTTNKRGASTQDMDDSFSSLKLASSSSSSSSHISSPSSPPSSPLFNCCPNALKAMADNGEFKLLKSLGVSADDVTKNDADLN
eukprot:jgi/Bigna1/84077/fgenesh1_pg.122_\